MATIGDASLLVENPQLRKTGGEASCAFHFVLIVAMKTTLLTYFLVVPIIPTIADQFHISMSTAWQLGTVYEVGKAVGSVVIGWCGARYGVLNAVICGSAIYAILSLFLGVLMQSPTASMALLTSLFVLYGAISVMSIVSQFGLAVLKSTTSDASSFRRLVQIQGLAAAVLQGASPLLGQVASVLSGYVYASFFLMCINGATSAVLLCWLRPREKEVQAVAERGTVAQTQPLLAGSDGNNRTSYWQQLSMLFTDNEYHAFRVHVLLLGICTSSLYIYPLMVNVALQEYDIDGTVANGFILAVFVPNILLRLIAILSPSRSASITSRMGTWLLVVGSGAMLALSLLVSTRVVREGIINDDKYLRALAVLAPGCILSAGIGATMPHCKASAMLNVPDDMNSTANSALKLMQLVCVGIMQCLCGLLAGEATTAVRNQSALLFVANVLGLLAFTA